MGRVKEIRLHPTYQGLRVYTGLSKKQLIEVHKTVYNDKYMDEWGRNFSCVNIDNQDRRWFCIFIEKNNIPIIVHECFHILQNLSKIIGSEIVGSKENPFEEWSAYMLAYMVENILNKEGYKEYGKNTRRKTASNSTRTGKHGRRLSEV